MKKKPYRSSYSLEHYIKVLISLSIPIIAINLIVSFFSIITTREQNIAHISNTITLYQNETIRKTAAVEHFVRWTAIHEPLVETIETNTNYGDRIDAITTFRTRVSDNQYATGKEFQYFLFLEKQNLFLCCSALNLSYTDYKICKKELMQKIESKETLKNSNDWKILKIRNNFYLYYTITYNNRTFVAFISAKDMLKPLEDVNLGTNGYMLMRNFNNTTLIGTSSKKRTKDPSVGNPLFLSRLVFTNKDTNLPFTLNIYIDNWFYERILFIQVFVIIMAFIVALTLFVFLFYMQKKVIKPIHNFSLNLSKINEGTNLLDLQDGNIIELEQASQQFKNLMREITKLKINLYEQELEKKRIQIGFLQQQIKPHFYLNCLTTIYSMAQTKSYKEIETMALFTSNYLRYLFQTNKDFISLEYELNHVNDYLSIQSLRYGSAFSYEYQVGEGTRDAVIPPLILMTFIENVIKHCVSLTITLKIRLSVKKYQKEKKDYLHIVLRDTGPGFTTDVLNALNNRQSLAGEDGTRIGISNAITRLTFLYGEAYDLKFSNNDDMGASIELWLPLQSE
ncbi:sensor histidine kinase [Anaerocolumna sp. MB42-C2]|uniref:sensor histidine kinase n=1 Tax=Anaerocolumna sp. MB42-C2 TaxID=3070997 RepID=UPI0027E0511E|nr:histidine kinase [Anaerocolumna sp. MB42-C2]WMJ89661.1 histidine kinase [Anaerocolumna sp. MB42-C2]